MNKNKIRHKAAKNVVYKKYQLLNWGFWGALLGIFYIEFLPIIHIPSIWNVEICTKINNITLQILLAYVASYIYFYLNIIKKEIKDGAIFVPHMIYILRDIFSASSKHAGFMMFLSKQTLSNDNFNYKTNEILDILSVLKTVKNSSKEKEELSILLCDNSLDLAKKISYDIELLNHFSESFDTEYKTLLYSISQNNFIQQLKDKEEITITDYERLFIQNIELHQKIELLRDKSEKIFLTEFP